MCLIHCLKKLAININNQCIQIFQEQDIFVNQFSLILRLGTKTIITTYVSKDIYTHNSFHREKIQWNIIISHYRKS